MMRRVTRPTVLRQHHQQHRMFFSPTMTLRCDVLSNMKSTVAEMANKDLPYLLNRIVEQESAIVALRKELRALNETVERRFPTSQMVKVPLVAPKENKPTVSSSNVFELCGSEWILQLNTSPMCTPGRNLHLFPNAASKKQRLKVTEGDLIYSSGAVSLTLLPPTTTTNNTINTAKGLEVRRNEALVWEMSRANYWGGFVPLDLAPYSHTEDSGIDEYLLVNVEFLEPPRIDVV